MKFILDGMLGKLSRWLRMIGYDTKYSNKAKDNELLKISHKEMRTLITRDLQLYQHAITKGFEAYYVEGKSEPERLADLSYRFGIELYIDLQKSLCPKCNNKLSSVAKNQVANRLAKNTMQYYDEYWLCPCCGAVYWQGGHWSKIGATLDEAKKILKKKSEN